MTSIAVKDIGFCAHFSPQGDWAFEFALSLARRLGHRLNIFYFPRLDSPSSDRPAGRLDEKEVIALDRRVREYYDEKLGDFVEAGFRVCEDFIDTELRRCLFRREYQVMLLGYPGYGARFGDDSIEGAREEESSSTPFGDSSTEAVIRECLDRNRGNRRETARELGMHRSTLWRKMRQYGICTS